MSPQWQAPLLGFHANVEVYVDKKYGENGFSLRATQRFEPGEWVWKDPFQGGPGSGLVYTRQELLDEPDTERRQRLMMYSYMVDHDTFYTTLDPVADGDPSWYFNHSCDGNVWYDRDVQTIVARKVIEAGDELAYDYCLTETEASMHAGMVCRCGTAACRGTLKFDDYRYPSRMKELQGHTTEYIDRLSKMNGWHDPRVYVARLPELGESARGLKTLQPIKKGEKVLVFSGKIVDYPELQRYIGACIAEDLPMHHLQVADSLFQIPGPYGVESADFINHACDSNCGMKDSVTVVARRDIAEGEQLTVDYALFSSGYPADTPSEAFQCLCKGELCRGHISVLDWQREDIQNRYGRYFAPFTMELVDAQRGQKSAAPKLFSIAVDATTDGIAAFRFNGLSSH